MSVQRRQIEKFRLATRFCRCKVDIRPVRILENSVQTSVYDLEAMICFPFFYHYGLVSLKFDAVTSFGLVRIQVKHLESSFIHLPNIKNRRNKTLLVQNNLRENFSSTDSPFRAPENFIALNL